jgi:antitoxin component of MazEF toxin-antitoxin module
VESTAPVGESTFIGETRVDIRRWVKHGMTMIKTIAKVGNSHGIIFDSALLQLARLKPGDEVNVEVHPGGTITITPMNPVPNPVEFTAKVEDVMQRYARTMKRLA